MEGRGDRKYAFISRVYKLLIDIPDEVILVRSSDRVDTHHNNIRTFAKPENWSSRERMAFCIVSSNVRPMLITSPTLFMLLLSSLDTRLNFLRSQRGILTTT